jgi:hypothetical protein
VQAELFARRQRCTAPEIDDRVGHTGRDAGRVRVALRDQVRGGAEGPRGGMDEPDGNQRQAKFK